MTLPDFPVAAGPLPFVGELAALFTAGVLVAYLCYRVRLVPIAGFLLAGVAIGPEALGLVRDVDLVAQLAEVGVILLLFSIGVEFSLGQMARLARPIFLGGGLQVALTIGVVAGIMVLLGAGVGVAVFTGFLVSLSSTAIVLKVLGERAETDTPVGRVALAMILFQDLVIVVMVLLIPALAGEGGSALDVAWALGKAVLVIAAVLVGARRVVPALLARIAETRRTELFLLAVAAVCLGTAWAVSLAGVSLAIGAFLAGLLVSESDYAEHALSEILPLQTLFTAAFFLSVGMLLDPAFLWENLGLVAGVAVAVLVLKAAVAAVGARLLGSPLGVALATGLTLAQIGEFSFVLALAGAEVGLLPGGIASGSQILIAVTVVLMLATPGLIALGPRLAALGRRVENAGGAGGHGGHGHGVDLEDHTVVVGYGLAGRRLARVLGESGIPYAVSDLNPQSLRDAEARGAPTVYGDASREPILRALGAERAKLLVVAINDGPATQRIVAVARHLNPTLQIFARTRFVVDVESLTRAGADIVVPEELEDDGPPVRPRPGGVPHPQGRDRAPGVARPPGRLRRAPGLDPGGPPDGAPGARRGGAPHARGRRPRRGPGGRPDPRRPRPAPAPWAHRHGRPPRSGDRREPGRRLPRRDRRPSRDGGHGRPVRRLRRPVPHAGRLRHWPTLPPWTRLIPALASPASRPRTSAASRRWTWNSAT